MLLKQLLMIIVGTSSLCFVNCQSGKTTWEQLFASGLSLIATAAKFENTEPRDSTPQESAVYDYIIVGAGTAGCTLASRLTEVPENRVLLIEAGGPETLFMDLPIVANYLQNTIIDWQYRTESSDTYCLAMNNRQCNWPRGKVMGGSSVLNYMIATRGNKRDYDRWAYELGNEGWSYEEVLPYFKKLERFESANNNTKYYGFNGGKLSTSYPKYQSRLSKAFIKSSREFGLPVVDYDAESQVGFSRVKTTTRNGLRKSSSRAYLHRARDRKNLFVSKHSLVTRVLIDAATKRAHGVRFNKNGRKMTVFASKEVILSAGAIATPQLLMLSGVGPQKHLTEMGITTIHDLPGIGENLMDHIAFGGLIFRVNQTVGIISKDILDLQKPNIRDFILNRDGPITLPGVCVCVCVKHVALRCYYLEILIAVFSLSTGGCEAVAFVDTLGSDFPDLELLFISGSVLSDPNLQHCFGISDYVWNKTYKKHINSHSWSIFPMLLRPKSRGRLLLSDKRITSHPRLVANYMSWPEDVKTLIKGIRLGIKVGQSKAMQKFGSTLYGVPLAGCEHYPADSDAYWECAVRAFPVTIYHYSGTCKMGTANDPMAVVNPRLQV